MKKLLISLVLVFGFATIMTSYMPATTTIVEAKEKKKKKKIFDKGWKTFKKKWKNKMETYDSELATIHPYKKSAGPFDTVRWDGKLTTDDKKTFVSASTQIDKNQKPLKRLAYAAVIGSTDAHDDEQERYNTEMASAVLILIADPTIPIKKRKQIAFKKLHIGEDHVQDDHYEYSYNGVEYSLEYDRGVTTVDAKEIVE
ncbi:hypothetical protein AAXE64_27005 [Priestia megaterium]